MSQTWMFQNEESRDKAKENVLPLRHPGNLTKWIDDFTVQLEGEVHAQTRTLLKQLRAKQID